MNFITYCLYIPTICVYLRIRKLNDMKNSAFPVKVNIENIKVGSTLITWYNQAVTVKWINKDKSQKPLIVDCDGKEQYYHYNQINEIV